MGEEVDYGLSIMFARYIRRVDSDDFESSSLMADMELCCMERPLDYFCFMSFSSNLLKQLDFEVRLHQVHSDPWARVLIGWQNIAVVVVRPSKRIRFYGGVDEFD